MAARKVHLIAAARPNFMKVAPLWHALQASGDYAPVARTQPRFQMNGGNAELVPASAQAMVELRSPTTTSQSGRSAAAIR